MQSTAPLNIMHSPEGGAEGLVENSAIRRINVTVPLTVILHSCLCFMSTVIL